MKLKPILYNKNSAGIKNHNVHLTVKGPGSHQWVDESSPESILITKI